MKARSLLWIGLVGLVGLSSCTDERIISQSTTINAIRVSGEDFTDGDALTRAEYTVDGTGFHFSWTEGDTVGIYPVGGDQVAFPISSGEGSKTAQFDGGAWALRSTYSYAAYYPFSSDNYKAKETSIPVSYIGQIQNGNGSLDCLDRFDYQASVATRPDANGNVNIALKHLGCFVRFQLTMPNADTYKSITLKSSKTPFVTSGTVDLTSDSIHITPVTTSQTITISLSDASTTEQDSVLVVYAMLAPVDMSDSHLTVTAVGTNGHVYASLVSGKNLIAGKAYSFKTDTNGDVTITEDGDIVPPDNEIWYVTTDNTIIDLEASSSMYNSHPFDVNVISHTYQNGKGIIRCDRPISIINDHVFGNSIFNNICNIYLPNSITTLKTGALRGIGVEELRIPDNLQTVDSYAISSNSLKRFTGKHTSIDGRCVIIEDGFMPDYGNTLTPIHNYMAAFAPSGVSDYTLPSQVEILGWYVFAWNTELRKISFNEGLKQIMGDCFVDVQLDCDINLPSTLEDLDPYAFRACTGIKGFYGNEKFHTPDHLCLTFEQTAFWNEQEKNGKWISRFIGVDETDYVIPEGIVGIENYAFQGMENLLSVTLPSSLTEIGAYAFYECPNLENLHGECVSEDHKGIILGKQFRKLVVTKGITKYTVPDGIESIGYNAFSESKDLEEIVIPDSVKELGGYDFAWCHNLKKVVLSSNLKRVNLYNPFLGSNNIEEIYFRSYMPPSYSDTQFYESDCSHLTVYVPEETLEIYKISGWSQYAPYMVGYKYNDIGEFNPDFYISSDYTADGQVTQLQESTIGNGLNLILMGDAFSDRQIADGTYAGIMQNAMDAFFSEEPYKSFKNYFNVYSVNIVSIAEGYEHSGQALSTGFGNGTYVYGNDAKVIEYAKKAIPEDKIDDAVIIVMMNEDAYAGTCFMYDAPDGDYGRGTAIAYFPTNSIPDNFNGLVLHEAGGHGFAKLADEYAYEANGTISQKAINSTKSYEPYGWWKNVDFTNDATQVKWSTFISDSRYANENIGCYEGGLTYWSGVWRPTENSIMRYNTGGFNAPSRYAIWYRINKLAYGDSWNGTYEDFVEYDAINRTPSAAARRTQSRRNYVEKPLPALAPPVVVGHSWREELNGK